VRFGGGDAYLNAATSIEFYTGANVTTRTGSKSMTVDSSGNWQINGTRAIQFQNENASIAALTGGHLDLTATQSIDCNATVMFENSTYLAKGYVHAIYTTTGADPAAFIGYKDALTLGLATNYHEFNITSYANHTKDHDHAAQTNPTVFLHSATSPDSDNTQWWSITHDRTDAYYDVGTGCHRFHGDVAVGATQLTNEGDVQLLNDGVLAMVETSTPTADADHGKLYTKNDNKLYFQDGAGTEHEVAYA
jgi:hypothetical protein